MEPHNDDLARLVRRFLDAYERGTRKDVADAVEALKRALTEAGHD